jgi:hypothetical protein
MRRIHCAAAAGCRGPPTRTDACRRRCCDATTGIIAAQRLAKVLLLWKIQVQNAAETGAG